MNKQIAAFVRRRTKCWIIVVLVACLSFFVREAVAKTASCPCSPCKCSPCTCGGGGGGGSKGKGGSDHHQKEKDHHGGKHEGHSGGASVGVGADVDLSGVGKRKSEPDPFASSNEPPSPKTAKAHEQTKTHKTEQTQDHTFDKVGLTGEIAKDEGKGPGVINVSDEAAPTGSPKTEGAPTKEIALTTDDLKKARDAYQTARSKFLKTDPDWQKYLKLLGQMERLDGDSDTWKKASAKSYKLMRHAVDTFDKSDEGKKLLQDWMKTYEVVNKAGNNITDDMVPPDDLEQARHKLAKAQSTLKEEQDIYDTWKKQTVSENNGVKNIQAAIDELKKKTHFSEADAQADRDKLKQLQADLDKAKKQTEKDWAATDAARDQMKKVQQAEKELDKARSDFKPFEGLEKNPTKAASNP